MESRQNVEEDVGIKCTERFGCRTSTNGVARVEKSNRNAQVMHMGAVAGGLSRHRSLSNQTEGGGNRCAGDESRARNQL
jgi:hypothetical protein